MDNTSTHTALHSVTLEGQDPAAAETFCAAAFGPDLPVRFRATEEPTAGFRGYSLSLVVSQPGAVDSLVGTALDAGATTLKAPTKGFWGYGGVVQAPDGAIWKIATSSKKDSGPVTREVDDVVLLLGVEDVKTSKKFYVERGLAVKRSFGGKYVEFDTPGSPLMLALYPRRALAKDVGVPPEGSGSHRLVIGGDAGAFSDPDGFAWQSS